MWLNTYEKELADSLGQQPAFTTTIMDKPSGAQISGMAQEFEGDEDPDFLGVEDEDLGFEDEDLAGLEDEDLFQEEMEEILMMEKFNVGE